MALSEELAPSHQHLATSDVQRLKEHQQSFKSFVQDWCSQHDQILQTISRQVEQSAPTCRDKFNSECSAARSEYLDEDGSPQVLHQRKEKDELKRSCSSSDVLGPLRKDGQVKAQAVSTLSEKGFKKLFSQQSLTFTQDLNPEVRRAPSAPVLNLVTSKAFEALCCLCIVANAAVMAFSADYAARHLQNPKNSQAEMLEKGFATFYTVELILRIVAHRCDFFRGGDWTWNLFDSVLVINAIYDQTVEWATAQKNNQGNVVFLRLVRLMKMLKLLRMVRIMRSFKELRLIVVSIRGSLTSMIWAILLIIMITYMVGICFLQAGTNYLIEHGEGTDDAIAIQLHWGTLSKAMLSLYMASTNGDAWRDMAGALETVGIAFYLLFLLYIAFFMFVVMNTLTSLFIEATIQNAEHDNSSMIRYQLQSKSVYIKRAVALFQKMDQDESGDISEEEFQRHAGDPEMVAFAASLELDVTDIAQFYRLLSCRGRYTVDLETFVVGCLKLKGSARSLDLQGLIAMERQNSSTLDHVQSSCSQILALVEKFSSETLMPSRWSPSAFEQPVSK